MYVAKPNLGNVGLSKLLVDTSTMALDHAEKKIEVKTKEPKPTE